jgi:hypothetical protein
VTKQLWSVLSAKASGRVLGEPRVQTQTKGKYSSSQLHVQCCSCLGTCATTTVPAVAVVISNVVTLLLCCRWSREAEAGVQHQPCSCMGWTELLRGSWCGAFLGLQQYRCAALNSRLQCTTSTTGCRKSFAAEPKPAGSARAYDNTGGLRSSAGCSVAVASYHER